MGRSINLLRNYPKSKRDLKKRLNNKSEKVRKIARKFGKDFKVHKNRVIAIRKSISN